MKPLTSDVKTFIKNNLQSHIDTFLKLAQIPAPSNHEEERAKFCLDVLQSYGAKGAYMDEVLNVIYPYHCEDAEEIFVISGHTDVVFPDTTPLPLRREGDIAYCPGIGDDTARAAIVLTLAKYLAETKPKTRCGILLSMVSGEEGLGNLKGVRKLMEVYGNRVKCFVTLDAPFARISDDAVGSTRYRVSVKEEGGHSYGRFGAKNAIAELSEIITNLYKIKVPVAEGTKTTYNVGMISGGISVNTIAPEATMLYEYRSDSAKGLQYMKERFFEVIEEARKACSEVSIEVVGERPCSNIDPEVQKNFVEEICCAHYLNSSEKILSAHSSTDCNIPLSLGIPSINLGTYASGGAHTRGEWLDLSTTEMALKIVFTVLCDMVI